MSDTGNGLRIMAGIDLTERSRNAFLRALELAGRPHAALTLLHVTSDALPSQLAHVHATFATDVMRDLSGKAHADGIEHVECVLATGRDYEAIIAEAHKLHADLIVVGTHRPSSMVQDMIGTTADRVLRHGGLPLLLVRQKPAGAYASILVAVDFSPASARALKLAAEMFPEARIAAVTAYGTTRRTLLGDDEVAREAAGEARRLALKGFLLEVREGSDPALTATLKRAETIVERGWAEDVILQAVETMTPDLIVVGTHARAGVEQAVIGSVAEWVLREAPCDVLAVPPKS